MVTEPGKKIRADHLQRNAYLYVRQSSVRQVYEHAESTKRQYALADRAVALGWPRQNIITIDSDLGQSGSTVANRDGFKKLVAEVGMGHAGIVIGIEVSRLARNSSDWHRLLEICALSETLILDEDGVYDPNDFNDRLVLGLKGTMSEAELHYLKARMWGGRLAKAKRGELKTPLPVGFRYADNDAVILDPDRQVQQVMRTFFDTFEKKRSARGVLQSFREQQILFPSKVLTGSHRGEVVWGPLLYTRAIQVLHNPHYAGVFSYGRIKTRHTPEGKAKYTHLPPEKWHACIRDAHAAYISFEQWEENQKIMAGNAQAYGADRRSGPPREGPALLQGLILCGKCGRRMQVNYRKRFQRLEGSYRCELDAELRRVPLPIRQRQNDRSSGRRAVTALIHSRGRWSWHSRSSTSSGNVVMPSTSCEDNICNDWNMRRPPPEDATCRWIRITGLWRIRWRRTGTRSSGQCRKPRKTTNDKKKRTLTCWARKRRNRSSHLQLTSRDSGAIPTHRTRTKRGSCGI